MLQKNNCGSIVRVALQCSRIQKINQNGETHFCVWQDLSLGGSRGTSVSGKEQKFWLDLEVKIEKDLKNESKKKKRIVREWEE